MLQVMCNPQANDLLLPLFIAEYQKDSITEEQALNQQFTYLILSVTFYKSIGIVRKHVYKLVADGHVGAILMAWYFKDANVS